MAQQHLFGFLIIDKPPRKTSRDVVNVVQRLARPARTGHAGTLDPLATGVLVVCVGPATRLVSMVQEGRKRYRAEFQFGVSSATDDLEGEVIEFPDAPRLTRGRIAAVLPEFRGMIEQVPPSHSAVHVNGRRAYQLARRGESLELAPRRVEVSRFEIENFEEPAQVLTCDIECGSGTYIRSLGRDIAARLGTGAVMTGLRRLAVGPFTLEMAIPLDRLTSQTLRTKLKPAAMAFPEREGIALTTSEWEEIRHGRAIDRAEAVWREGQTGLPLLHQGRLVAVARYDEQRGGLRPEMVFPFTDGSLD